MANQGRSIVVFDLGGVLIDWDPRHLYRKLFADNERRWSISLQGLHPGMEPPARTRAAALPKVRRPQDRAPREGGPHRRLWRALRRDGGRIDLRLRRDPRPSFTAAGRRFMRSPTGRPRPIRRPRRFAFLGWFRGMLVSGEVGRDQAEPRIYEAAHRALRIDPRTSRLHRRRRGQRGQRALRHHRDPFHARPEHCGQSSRP